MSEPLDLPAVITTLRAVLGELESGSMTGPPLLEARLLGAVTALEMVARGGRLSVQDLVQVCSDPEVQ